MSPDTMAKNKSEMQKSDYVLQNRLAELLCVMQQVANNLQFKNWMWDKTALAYFQIW